MNIYRLPLGALVCVAALAVCASAQSPVAFTHARIIDGMGHGPYENATLLITGDRITAINGPVPDEVREIDLTGKTIIPGLINAHGHLGVTEGVQVSPANFTRENIIQQLDTYLRYGVTTMMALGVAGDLIYELRDAQKRGELEGATIYTAGRGIGVPGGAPPMNVGPDQIYRPASAEGARAAVREMAAHHPDIIKIWVDDIGGTMPKMKPEIYRAVIDEAHQNKLRVAAHIYYLSDAKALVDDGVDVLAHSVRDKPVDSALLNAMKARNVIYIPTLELEESFFLFVDHPDWAQDGFATKALSPEVRHWLASREFRDKVVQDPATAKHRKAFEMALKNLLKVQQAGVRVAMGTDSGATPLRVQGYAEHLELSLMVQAGMTPMDVLVAATRNGAAVCGASDRGTLEPGHYADLLMLNGNPLAAIEATRDIDAVWKSGRKVDMLVHR